MKRLTDGSTPVELVSADVDLNIRQVISLEDAQRIEEWCPVCDGHDLGLVPYRQEKIFGVLGWTYQYVCMSTGYVLTSDEREEARRLHEAEVAVVIDEAANFGEIMADLITAEMVQQIGGNGRTNWFTGVTRRSQVVREMRFQARRLPRDHEGDDAE